MISGIIVKTSQECNLGCPHCDYFNVRPNLHESGQTGAPPGSSFMTVKTACKLFERVAEYVEGHGQPPHFEFYWHGGEPLLAPKGYYQEMVAIQRYLLPSHIKVSNNLMTNGTLLDDNWIDELERSGIGVCLSLDGPRHIHDTHRLFRNGSGSYELVVRAIRRLVERDVRFAVLTVVHPEADGAQILAHHLSLGIRQLDFILPARHYRASTVPYELGIAEENRLSQYLISAFDAWFEWNPDRPVGIRSFDSALGQVIGKPALLCSQGATCGSGTLTVRPDGRFSLCESLSLCDDYDTTEHDVWDIGALSAIQRGSSFCKLHDGSCIPAKCRTCEVGQMCNGHCPASRYDVADGMPVFNKRPSVYCNVLKALFNHIFRRLCDAMVHL
jgi:uncharacterized protein